MNTYQQNLQEEKNYLEKTVTFIKKELETKGEDLVKRKHELIASRKDMTENTVSSTRDFTKLIEFNQYLSEVNIQAASYFNNVKNFNRLEQVKNAPYFGRFDFMEDGYNDTEKIYIGLYNVMDSKNHKIYVYDWRAPISSMFYQYELGKAAFHAPNGEVTGDVLLKRQYKIKDAKLKYFFDCSVRINDEILQEVLSHNASSKMKNIVETIQKEQDIIIRDTDNDLLIVQGVAGSGKTSIALHRIAYLLYHGLNIKLNSNNIIIISPNAVFSKYISNVLPELGEENVEQSTFDDITESFFKGRFITETRHRQLESIVNVTARKENDVIRQSLNFKGSKTFIKILNNFLSYYEHRMLPFEDVCFHGTIIETRQRLKNRYLNNKVLPMAKQLKRIENMLLEKFHPLQKERLKKIEEVVQRTEGRDLEIKSFSRLLAIKEAKIFLNRLHKFTKVDYFQLYQMLFDNKALLLRLARGHELPENIDQIITHTKERLSNGEIRYEDCAPLLFLKLNIEGNEHFSEIKQVVIDEAQDYYPIHYEIFKLLFPQAKYTILGDINQTIEKVADVSLYDNITKIFNKEKTTKLFLNKGYRSSYEINLFTQKLLGNAQVSVAVERHETKPSIAYKETKALINKALICEVEKFVKEGYESIAIICKSQKETETVHLQLENSLNINILHSNTGSVEKGVIIIPSYMAKGLEFDAVIVYDANKNTYSSEFDKHLLYIACTRALHRLTLYYTEKISPFLQETQSLALLE